jgi:hypothetical protein
LGAGTEFTGAAGITWLKRVGVDGGPSWWRRPRSARLVRVGLKQLLSDFEGDVAKGLEPVTSIQPGPVRPSKSSRSKPSPKLRPTPASATNSTETNEPRGVGRSRI